MKKRVLAIALACICLLYTSRKAGFSKSAAGSGNEWTTAVCLPERIEIRASQISLHKRAF